MSHESPLRSNLFDTLTRRFKRVRDGLKTSEIELLEEVKGRMLLVVKSRWLLLFLIGLYGVFAGVFYYFSRFGLFLSHTQLLILFGTLAVVVFYNAALNLFHDSLIHIPFVNHIQIVLDLALVTVLIHISGGAASWFWPVYLIVTIEASYLLERKTSVWCIGAVGGLLFGALLAMENFRIIPIIKMPFVLTELHHDALYQFLIWLWVSLLNATVAVIGAFLMSVIRRENKAFRESEERLVNFLDSANDLIVSIGPDGRLLYVNNSWQQTLGYTADEARALSFLDIVHEGSQERCGVEMKRALSGDNLHPLEAVFMAKNGLKVVVEGNLTCGYDRGEPSVVWGICRDITERKKVEEQLYRLAHHDTLTGLPNRLLFLDRLHQAKALASRYRHLVALLFLDLDRFKIINDTLGHPVGDKLLQEVTIRIAGCVREVDTVARIGGDEFTVVLVNVDNADDAKKVAQKILKSLSVPFLIENYELFITASIGIAMYPADSENLDTLVKKADIAMYHAKGEGRNNFQFYAPQMDENADKRLLLETSLRKALDRDEFRIYYQPKVDVVSGRITAMEALLRWKHPSLGLVSPAEFIPIAEETGLIIPIGNWVLHTACSQNKAWQEQGLPSMRVAVNLSGFQFQQKNLFATITEALEATGLSAEFLELEITESVIMQHPDSAVQILNELKDIGVHISIDDFGTGYSSLAHLKRFSVNTLKIDKSFVRDVEVDSADAAITTAIITMGNSLNLKVIAEGVETEGQFSFLSANKCDEVQGFLFSTPMPSEDVVKFMREREMGKPEQ